ncbi:MAG: tetratricopeptide repeat protein, partial [Phormidium sp.]
MDENRVQNYLNLIQQLLNCPSGEEPEILQANSQLLDLEFLQVGEAVAAQLAEAGNENEANFLRNLVSQLGEILGMNEAGDSDNSESENPQIYREFILELLQAELQAEQDSNSDVAVIYPMLAQRQHLLNGRFAEILQQVAESLIADEEPETIKSILGIIENLSIDITNFPLGQRANNIEIAITGYQIVLSHREPGSEKWAQTQNNLATAYLYRIRGERADNLENAITFYTNALQVRTREAFPQQWATTQNNLGEAYRNRIRGERAENLENAIAFYTNALQVYTREAFPQQWATTQNNLANAYCDR